MVSSPSPPVRQGEYAERGDYHRALELARVGARAIEPGLLA